MCTACRVLAAPQGSSWRVTVLPPLPAAKGATAVALRSELLETQRAARAVPAVAQLQLVTDDASSQLLVDLYPLQALTGVLELDATGSVSCMLEERTRPVGLLFGVDTAALLHQQLRSWVALPVGCSSFTDLLCTSGAKKSSLKHTQKDPPVKVRSEAASWFLPSCSQLPAQCNGRVTPTNEREILE